MVLGGAEVALSIGQVCGPTLDSTNLVRPETRNTDTGRSGAEAGFQCL